MMFRISFSQKLMCNPTTVVNWVIVDYLFHFSSSLSSHSSFHALLSFVLFLSFLSLFFCRSACGGTDQYCPEGSPLPVPVSIGYHTINGPPLRRSSQSICDPGSYCDTKGVRRLCPAGSYGNINGMLEGCEAACPKGHYCTIGSTAPVPCPAGLFGDRTNLTTVACSGRCYEGYYCDIGSPSATQHECGDEKYICPVGSGPTGSGAAQERTLRLYSGAGGVECDPDASFYGECPTNTIEASHSSYSYGDDRFDPYANMPAGWVA